MNIQWIKHRVNQVADLHQVNPQWGVEIDLRADPTHPGRIYLAHDPWLKGDDFDQWLIQYVELRIEGPIILNTKEDGLEEVILQKMKRMKIQNFFFLDTVFPTLVKWSKKLGEDRFALRLSTYEPIEMIAPFIGKIRWLWIDCFQGIPFPVEKVLPFQDKIKICLVSPELQGNPLESSIDLFLPWAKQVDAICTKHPEIWQAILEKKSSTA